jgi:valyl-tRNA synthetase
MYVIQTVCISTDAINTLANGARILCVSSPMFAVMFYQTFTHCKSIKYLQTMSSLPLYLHQPTVSTAGASHSSPEPQQPSSPVQRKKKRGARLRKVVSNITKRVANNRLVRRATERAVEKASNIPLELTVEVRKLKGVVAVNIPPPPSDTIW